MDKAVLDGLLGSVSDVITCAFTGTDGAAIDCGLGRCPVAILIETALNAGAMTFKTSPRQTTTEPTLVLMKKEGETTIADYSIDHGAVTALISLSPTLFHSQRWVQPISDAPQTGKTVFIVTDVV